MKLEIKQEFINWDNRLLQVFTLLMSDNYSLDREIILWKENPYLLIHNNKDKILKTLQFLENKLLKHYDNWEIKTFSLNNKEIHEIVANNKYEPYSYHFIISFFNDVIWWDFARIYPVSRFISSDRYNIWLLRNLLNNFLEIFTNINDLRKDFLNFIDSTEEKVLYIHNRERSIINYFIYESFPIKNKKKIEEKLQNIHVSLLDWKAFSLKRDLDNLNPWLKIENLTTPYYFEELENIMRLNNFNSLFL
jgi:hypothetical protein